MRFLFAPFEFLLFVSSANCRIARLAEHFVLLGVSIETGRLCDSSGQVIIRDGLTDEGLEVRVEMAAPWLIEFLCKRGKIMGLCSCGPIDAESGALRHDGMHDHDGSPVTV